MSSAPVSKPPYDPKRRYTVAEYLALDASDDDERYEYLDGYVTARRANAAAEVFDMAGASFNHGRIARNLVIAISKRLTGGCEAFMAEQRVRMLREQLYAYPDVTVACPPVESVIIKGVETLINPTLVIEVLSKSTETEDRGPKFTRYREIESLREYILVSQFEQLVEPFYKTPEGIWAIGTPVSGPEATIRLNSLNIEIPLTEIYAGVLFAETRGIAADAVREPDRHPSP